MKNLSLILFAFLVASFMMSCDGGTNQPAKKMIKLEGEGFSITYPEDWSLDSTETEGVAFSILSPRRDLGDKELESVSLVKQDLVREDWNLDSFVVYMEGYIPSITEELKILENERKEANGKAFHRILYTGSFARKDIKYEQRYWVEGAYAYTLAFSSSQKDYDWFKEEADQMMDSFTFK